MRLCKAMMRVLPSDGSGEEWDGVLDKMARSDFYHTRAYHAHAALSECGAALLWVYEEGEYTIALPLVVRPLESAEGFAGHGHGWFDATSVYGYTGPVASHAEIPEEVLRRFRRALEADLRARRIIAVFSRLHPLIPHQPLLTGLGEQSQCGLTVSIPLTRTPREQLACYRSSLRRQIRKLRESGMEVVRDVGKERLGDFVEIYTDTMRRVHAREMYFFDRAYFEGLCACSPARTHLFFVLLEGKPVAGGLFLEHGGILEYHLGGTHRDALCFTPAKLLMDEVRLWAHARGCTVFHLGGGLGGKEDRLLYFKTGFSDAIHPFSVWRWIVDPCLYRSACDYRAALNLRRHLQPGIPGFFPGYRTPSVPEMKLLQDR